MAFSALVSWITPTVALQIRMIRMTAGSTKAEHEDGKSNEQDRMAERTCELVLPFLKEGQQERHNRSSEQNEHLNEMTRASQPCNADKWGQRTSISWNCSIISLKMEVPESRQ